MKTIGLIVGMCLCGLLSYAQCGVDNKAMQAGETLTYDLRFNWKFVWVKAGTASMKTVSTTYHGKPALRTHLQTKGNKRADFFFVMRDTLESTMSPDLVPYHFRKGAEEGKKYTLDEVNFSYENGQTLVRQSRKRPGKQPRYSETTENRCVYDMLSLLARARSLSAEGMKVGHKLVFPMATGTKVEDQTLIYRGVKRFTADDGVTYRCLVFSLVEYKKKKEKEVITFYVTDDDNHLPVRLDLYLNFGSAKAFLTRVEGNRHPLTSIEKRD